jgi:sensor histidine kinase YesM
MFTEMCNLRSSGYPLMNVTKYGVDGVISLNCLADSWVWRSLILNLLIIFLVFIIVTPRILQLNFFFSLLAKIRALPFPFLFPLAKP